MDIQIVNMKYKYEIADYYNENKDFISNREMQLSGYIVEFYLNQYIKSSIDIKANKELSIEEIKNKIQDAFQNMKKTNKTVKQLTYQDIINKFYDDFGRICDIADCRPSGNCAIDVWLKNGIKVHAIYNPNSKNFEIHI